MAHFLEHMLFMGSEKYPQENEYDKYISKKGGNSNAYTSEDQTVFFYDVLPEALDESIGRFSAFFKSPLMRKDSIERELEAVHSEHISDLFLDYWRIHRLLGVLRKQGSVLGKFATGSKSTLKGEDLRDRVHEFWRTNYSAEKFCIALGGSQSFDVLEGYARKYFEGIPVREEQEEEDSSSEYFQYDERYTGKLVRIKPSVILPGKPPAGILRIIVTIPETRSLYKKKVDTYIKFLLETSKDGGFVHTMKCSGYMSSISVSFDRRTVNTEITVEMELLPKGEDKIAEIKGLLKEYVRILRQNVSENIFNVLKRINQNLLTRLEGNNMDSSLVTQAITVAVNSHYFPMEDVLVNEMIYGEYDDKCMKRMLDIVADDKKWMHVYVTTKGEFDLEEEHYKFKYGIGDYSELDPDDAKYKEVLGKLKWPFSSESPEEISYEVRNENVIQEPESVVGKTLVLDKVTKVAFEDLKKDAEDYVREKATDGKISVGGVQMDVLPQEDVEGKMFSCGLRNEYGELRYVLNKELSSKEVVLYISVTTEDKLSDVDKASKYLVHLSGFFNEFLDKYSHDCAVLNVNMDVKSDEKTLLFKAIGPSVGVYAFAELFFREYKRASDRLAEGIFEIAKSQKENELMQILRDDHQYTMIKPEAVIRMSQVGFRTRTFIDSIGKIKNGDRLSKISKGHVQFMVSGNGSLEEAVELYRRIRPYMEGERITRRRAYPVDMDGVCIEGRESLVIDDVLYAETEDKKNNTVGILQDVGPAVDKRVSSIATLVAMVAKAEFFDQLRTKETLGYVVFTEVDYVDNACVIIYIVQGEKCAEQVQRRIEKFIGDMHKMVEDMSEKEYNDYVSSAADAMKDKEKSLNSYCTNLFSAWKRGEFDLKRKDEMSTIIRGLKKGDVLKFLREKDKRVVIHAVHRNKRGTSCEESPSDSVIGPK